MKLDVSCTSGHRWQIDQRLAGQAVRCPECNESVDVPRPGASPPAPPVTAAPPEATTGTTAPEESLKAKSRGLWSLMGGSSPPSTPVQQTPAEHTSNAPTPPPPVSDPQESSVPDSPPPRKRGLWSIMGAGTSDSKESPPESPQDPQKKTDAEESVELEPVELEPVELEDVRQSSGTQSSGTHDVELEEDDGAVDEFELDELDSDELDSVELEPAAIPVAAPIAARRGGVTTGLSRHAFHSLIAGLLAMPAAAFAVVPAFWSRLPATVLGFTALAFGLIAMQEIQRSRGQMTGRAKAVAGMILGTLGMFLGPVIISRMELWDASAQAYTRSHLTLIGEAIDQYAQTYEDFPPGGTSRQNRDGELQRMHSWMTRLLPYVGQLELYQSIDLNLPYDAPENAEAMRQTVPAYLASGASSSLVLDRFGVSHYAGLGGDVLLEEGGFARAGIFGMNTIVNREDVLDGLSQTLIVGEITSVFLPWGDPENWRTIGRGLNKDVNGFGNANNTGAMFLMGDGSVRFFSNATDPELLRRMSTRDGEEPLPRDEGIRSPVER